MEKKWEMKRWKGTWEQTGLSFLNSLFTESPNTSGTLVCYFLLVMRVWCFPSKMGMTRMPVPQGFPENKMRSCMPSSGHIASMSRRQAEAGVMILLHSEGNETQRGEVMCPRSHGKSTLGLWAFCPKLNPQKHEVKGAIG